MKTLHLLGFTCMSGILLAGCNQQPEVQPDNVTPDTTAEYTQESWRSMIDDSCLSFFDGCNNCVREAGSDMAACTRKFCMNYEKPECVDQE